jgi:class 3 adenylate cyclase
MDNKTIFVKTSKGEDEMQGRSSHLPDHLKRALLMVDGTSTFSEISKRAAPSMRASLGETFEELEKTGFIQDKAMVGKTPKMAVPQKISIPGKMSVPSKMVTPHKKQPVDEDAGELDFLTGFPVTPPETPAIVPDNTKSLRAEAEERSKQQFDAEKIKVQQEAEAIRVKAEHEAARIREEAVRRAREEAEAKSRREAAAQAAKLNAGKDAGQLLEAAIKAQQREAEAKRLQAEQPAGKGREEIGSANLKPEQDSRQHFEAAIREQQLAAEAARLLAEQQARKERDELDAARLKAEQEAKLRLEAAARERERAEAARIKAEQEAAKIQIELEMAKLRAEQEARARLEAEARERERVEAVRIKAEQEAAKIRIELEAAKLRAEQEAKARLEAEAIANARIKAEAEAAKAREAAERMSNEVDKPVQSASTKSRSNSATVLFFDVVGYTKLSVNKQIEIKRQFNQIVSGCLKTFGGDEQHIILDTGDGAAIGFLQHPEDALEVAIKFRNTVLANQHLDYPDLKVRIGIHFGPINIEKDMNGQSNMVGDGINDAQRVMSFAGVDQIFISRPYYDYISRLNDENADLFRYRGMQEDKHGREHPIYELVDSAPDARAEMPQTGKSAATIEPSPFSFDSFQVDQPQYTSEPQAEKKQAKNQSPAQVSPQVAGEPVENKPGNEQIKQEVQERIAAEKHSVAEKKAKQLADAQAKQLADAETKQLADAQAKIWAEAEQRALEIARADTERAAHQAEYPPAETGHVEKPVRVARVRRKPFAWGRLAGFFFKLGVFLLVLLAGVLFIVPYALPMRDYMPKVQQLLSARLHQPVHLGNLSGRILPMPRLELGEIYIGDAKQFQAVDAQINFDLMGLFTDAKPISSVEFHGVKIRGAWVRDVAVWLQQLASDKQYPVSRMVISQGTLDADTFRLTGIEGNLNFNPAGKFTQANLRAEAGKFTMDLIAAPGNKFQTAVTVRNSALPLLPNWSFDELDAKGELSDDELLIKNFDARMLGGIVQGNATINWRSGWHAQGALSAKSIIMKNMNKLLDGNVEGSARFKMASMDLAGLTGSVVLDGSFKASDGLISGMAIVETARMRSKENLPGGRTHFDELGGDISYADDAYHFKQVKVDAGVMNATATFDVTKQQLSGKMSVKLSANDGGEPVSLQMGGAIDSPTLRYVP